MRLPTANVTAMASPPRASCRRPDRSSDRPVILLNTFGRTVSLPKDVASLADEVIEWDERALSDAVRRHARHQDTTRWDTIEFKLD